MIKDLIARDIAGAMACLIRQLKIFIMARNEVCDLFSDTSRYDRFIERTSIIEEVLLNTGFIELDRIIGGIDLKEEKHGYCCSYWSR